MSSLARKIKRQAERQKHNRTMAQFKEDTINLAPELFSQKKIQIGRTHGKKISEALLELIQPYQIRLKINTLAAMQNLVLLGATAWAVALKPESDRAATMHNLLQTFPTMDKDMQRDVEDMVWGMVRRKLALFPDDKRVIVNCKVLDEGGNWQVNIAALEGK
jgi:hypothetical protein